MRQAQVAWEGGCVVLFNFGEAARADLIDVSVYHKEAQAMSLTIAINS